jgi:hypothetical protein
LDEVKMKFKKIENNNLEWMEYSNYGWKKPITNK